MPVDPRLRVMPISPKHADAQALARTIVEGMRGGISSPPLNGAVPSPKTQQD
jgi:hypothetical protein